MQETSKLQEEANHKQSIKRRYYTLVSKWESLNSRNKAFFRLIPVLLIVLVLPLIVLLSQKQQNISQKAAAPDQLEAEGGVLGGNATVIADTNASGGHFVLFAASAPTPTNTITPIPTPKATPTPTPTSIPNSQKIVQFPATGTQAQFVALMKDMSVDVIEIAAGTYTGWHIGGSGQPIFAISRAARPLLVRPASGAAVVWDGTGTAGDGWFYAGDWHTGGSTITDYITFDPAGTGGSFTLRNYALGQSGLISTFWTNHVTFNGFSVRNVTGIAGGQTSWAVYLSSDDTHRGGNLTFNDWDVVVPAGHSMSGFQAYHATSGLPVGITLKRWIVDGAHVAMLAWGDVSGVDVENWIITNSDYAVDTDGIAAGILKNNTASGSTYAPIIKAPMVDGGGNVWK